MTDELIEVKSVHAPVMVRCHCKKRRVNDKEIARPKDEQPLVLLRAGLDPAFIAGQCSSCGMQHIQRLMPKQKKVKHENQN